MPGPKKKQIDLGGRIVEAVPVSIVSEREFWNTYDLEDGSIVRVKLVAQEILRVEGMWDADGNPVYVVRSTNVTAVDGNDTLRRKE
ncbi:MAG TPA: hypothetical protein VHF22_09120 [Planctomycetota bacterium]|nr:hypothetical protein [Planctomycetota bacterium]